MSEILRRIQPSYSNLISSNFEEVIQGSVKQAWGVTRRGYWSWKVVSRLVYGKTEAGNSMDKVSRV